MASRLNVVDHSETGPVSPSQCRAVVQLADGGKRRARKGAVAGVEDASARRRSPRPSDDGHRSPSDAVDRRVGGPADWAVTETGSSLEEDSNQCCVRRARSAWGSQCDEEPLIRQNRSMY